MDAYAEGGVDIAEGFVEGPAFRAAMYTEPLPKYLCTLQAFRFLTSNVSLLTVKGLDRISPDHAGARLAESGTSFALPEKQKHVCRRILHERHKAHFTRVSPGAWNPT